MTEMMKNSETATPENAPGQELKLPGVLEDWKYSLFLAVAILGVAIGWSIASGNTSWQKAQAQASVQTQATENAK